MHSTGLVNMGNTCGFNALLQCMVHTPELITVLSSTNGPLSDQIRDVMNCMTHSTNVCPGGFLKAVFDACGGLLEPGAQSDVTEIWMVVATALAREGHQPSYVPRLQGDPAPPNVSPILVQSAIRSWLSQNRDGEGPWTDATHGMMVRQTKCQACGYMCHNFETFSSLWLDIPEAPSNAPLSLTHAITFFLQPEVLDAWRCDACKASRPAERSAAFWRLPTILVFALKRFVGHVKNTRPVSLPIQFTLSPGAELHPSGHPSSSYRLTSIANHQGALHGGHYTAVCRKGTEWLSCDDTTLLPLGPQHEHVFSANPNAYLLVFERCSSQ